MVSLPLSAELTQFIDSVQHSSDTKTMPLFVIDAARDDVDETFWATIDSSLLYYKLSSSYDTEAVRSAIVLAQKDARTLLIDVRADPHPDVLGLLNHVVEEGCIRGLPGMLESIVRITSPIWVAVPHDLLHGGISYPGFLGFFGPKFTIR